MFTFIAYLDPGTGSLILQMVVGGVLGALMFFKLMWHRIKSGFARLMGRPDPSNSEDSEPPSTGAE